MSETHLQRARWLWRNDSGYDCLYASLDAILAYLEQQEAHAETTAEDVRMYELGQRIYKLEQQAQVEIELRHAARAFRDGAEQSSLASSLMSGFQHLAERIDALEQPAPVHEHSYTEYHPANEIRGPIWTCKCDEGEWRTVPPQPAPAAEPFVKLRTEPCAHVWTIRMIDGQLALGREVFCDKGCGTMRYFAVHVPALEVPR